MTIDEAIRNAMCAADGMTAEGALWDTAAFRRALAEAGMVVEQNWQPIETAPKNGTQVLLCYSRVDLSEHWPLVLIASCDKEGYWVWQGRASRSYSVTPLGWRPLPSAMIAASQA